jgi:hypothetical protein
VDLGGLLVVLVVLASTLTGLHNGFAYDDVAIVRDSEAVHAWRWPWAFLRETYWMPPYGQALYRPLTIGLFSVQWMVGGGAPLVFHLVNIVVYAVAAVLVWRLARRLMRPAVALGVALLWAAHPVHVEVVGNVVGQSELWVAVSALVALLLVERVIAEGTLTRARALGLVGCVAAGLLAKENGVVLPVLLGLRLIPWLRDPSRAASERAFGWRLLRSFAYVVALYLGARFAVLGTLGGDGSHLSIAELSTGQRLFVALAVRVTEARLLFLGPPLAADYSPPAYPLHPTFDAWHLVALGVIALWVGAAWWLRRRGHPIWPFLWVPVAMAPTANVAFPTGIVMAERSLFLPSIGVLLAAGLCADVLVPWSARALGAPVRRLLLAAFALIVGASAAASAARQPEWRDSHTLVATSLIDAPTNPSWQRVLGLQFLRSEELDRAEVHLRIAEDLGPPDLRLLNGMRMVLERQGRCAEALSYHRRLIVMYAVPMSVELGQVACLLRLGRNREARLAALRGRATAAEPMPYRILLDIADSILLASDSGGPINAWRSRGKPVGSSGEPIVIEVTDWGGLVRRDLHGWGLVDSSTPSLLSGLATPARSP